MHEDISMLQYDCGGSGSGAAGHAADDDVACEERRRRTTFICQFRVMGAVGKTAINYMNTDAVCSA
jgi:hypothetical protein